MRGFTAFFKKECTEHLRSGRGAVLIFLFLLLGIMNPAIAKLTPWMLEMMSDSLAESGMTVTEVTVNAMTSWTQFFKNIPMGLIAFVLLESAILTKEVQTGSLIPILTKGLPRGQVVLAKGGAAALLWSLCFWLCFGVSYLYTAYYWDQTAVSHLFPAVLGWWVLGLWAISLCLLFSAFASSQAAVMLGCGGSFLGAYLLGLFPKLARFSPAALMKTQALLTGGEEPIYFLPAYALTLALTAGFGALSLVIFDRRKI